MTRINAAADQVRDASGLPAVLDAACEAFQEILTTLRACEDESSRWLVPFWLIPFAMAATSAADGRDTLLFAPSLPPARQHPLPVNGASPTPEPPQLARDVAALATLLADRLGQCAGLHVGEGDREACRRAAAHARDIRRLLTGTGP